MKTTNGYVVTVVIVAFWMWLMLLSAMLVGYEIALKIATLMR